MVQLGRHFGRGPASLAEIAAEEDLPRGYLEQLVMSLRDADLVPPRLLAVKSLAAASGKTGTATVTPTAEQKPIHGALTPS